MPANAARHVQQKSSYMKTKYKYYIRPTTGFIQRWNCKEKRVDAFLLSGDGSWCINYPPYTLKCLVPIHANKVKAMVGKTYKEAKFVLWQN